MTDQPEPRPLSDADLLAWAVVLSYRDQQERDGIKILALPFPPCPTCGETVHKAVASWVREPFREEVTIDVHPCEHAHAATFADLERIHDHASEMLASLRLDDRFPGGEGRSTDGIVREARARVGEPEEAGPEPAPWSQLEAHAFNAVQPHLAAHYQHAVDAAVAAEQRATQAEAAVARVREVSARIRQGAPWTANHDAIADRLEAALDDQGKQP